jgi:hypothetical protein
VPTHGLVSSDEIARSRKEIGKIERAGGHLQLPIVRGRAGQFLLQRGGQIRVRVFAELLKLGEKRVARG